MNIYERKSRWKLWLLLFAAVIVLASLWYTNILATRIAREEQKQVQIWAQAVENKARLVRYMRELFDRMAHEERKKVELWAQAFKLINEPQDDVNTFAFEVLKNNETIPVIAVDEQDIVLATRNLDTTMITISEGDEITELQKEIFTDYDPIIFENPLLDTRTYIYYRDSKLFSDLKIVLEDFVNSFISEDVMRAASVPVIFTDTEENIIEYSNIDSAKIVNQQSLDDVLQSMKSANDPIAVDLGDGNVNYVYYQNSELLNQITYYPYIQLGIIALFLIVAYFAFSTARRAEQNQVWVGMSKETAHQLGTPISSLMAWVEYLKETGSTNDKIVAEIEKDVNRLELIAERFSKVGSSPDLHPENIALAVHQSMQYLKARTSKKVIFEESLPVDDDILVNLNIPLFEWVIENLIKNALDAMEGVGKITVEVGILDNSDKAFIDISDTGKGISGSKFKTVFEPGYSTKKRGWGLGLTLTKRIVEIYHSGKVFVKESHIGRGTTFRIVLPRVK